MNERLVNPKGFFTRGKHNGKVIDHVARTDVQYLVWIVEESYVDEGSKQFIEIFLNQNPDYLENHRDYK